MASGKYTDLHIHSENVTFEAHRAVICSRSPVLANLVDKLDLDVRSTLFAPFAADENRSEKSSI